MLSARIHAAPRSRSWQRGSGTWSSSSARGTAAGTLALQEFLTRNNQPYAYLDVDRDADVQTTLDSFGVGVGRHTGLHLPWRARPQEADHRGGRGVPRLEPGERGGRPRRRHRRGGSGRSGGRRLRGVRGRSTCSSSRRARRAGRRGRARASRTISGSRRESRGRCSRATRSCRRRSSARSSRSRGRRRGSTATRRPYRVDLGGASIVQARTVIVATGVQYRKPDSPTSRASKASASTTGRPVEAHCCKGEDVVVVGGGNSAGQAAVFLSASRARSRHRARRRASPRACRAT